MADQLPFFKVAGEIGHLGGLEIIVRFNPGTIRRIDMKARPGPHLEVGLQMHKARAIGAFRDLHGAAAIMDGIRRVGSNEQPGGTSHLVDRI